MIDFYARFNRKFKEEVRSSSCANMSDEDFEFYWALGHLRDIALRISGYYTDMLNQCGWQFGIRGTTLKYYEAYQLMQLTERQLTYYSNKFFFSPKAVQVDEKFRREDICDVALVCARLFDFLSKSHFRQSYQEEIKTEKLFKKLYKTITDYVNRNGENILQPGSL